ncbi:MAG: hypothetical protein QM308_10480 [Bacillota bacterium]|nr:hypothetical protein [Bacillota bacterium]
MTSGSVHFIIVNRGKANGLLRRAQEIGAKRGTIFLGEGTMSSRWLELLGVNQSQKEVLLIAVPDEVTERFYTMLKKEFNLHKKYQGIAFSVPYRTIIKDTDKRGEAVQDYKANHICLMTVLERGLAGECMRIARGAGARGGTILNAHGAGVPQDFYFPLVIEPQKEILMIVAPRENAPKIRDAIFENMRLERKGAGIIFALPVTRTLGLYEERQQERTVSP